MDPARPAPRHTFPRRLRVVRTGDFARAFREGSRARGAQLLVVARPNGLPHARLGLSVGRSTWRSAVRRNRVKRVFREAFRLEQHELPAGYDLILVPAAPRLAPDLAATRRELVRLARKAARRCEEKAGRRAGATADEASAESS